MAEKWQNTRLAHAILEDRRTLPYGVRQVVLASEQDEGDRPAVSSSIRLPIDHGRSDRSGAAGTRFRSVI
jgi:hypothetical protein